MSRKQQAKSKRKAHLWLIIALIFLAAWVPRVFGLDQFVTPDERKWLARSANFYHAISHGDLANTFQREHPGVTVMWAGTLAFWQHYPDYAQEAPGQFTWEDDHLEQWLLKNTNHKPLELLAAGRWWIVLAISLALALSYLPLHHLFGEKFALLALLFVIWNPFHIALSRQLHPDGLSATLTFLALTTFLVTRHAGMAINHANRYLLFSAVSMGLAWLTKSPTILLAPICLLLVVGRWLEGKYRGQESHRSLSSLLANLLAWGILSLIIFVGLWPSMWVDPIGTLIRMAVQVDLYIEGHGRANYFLGQPTADPGLIFYPVAYLFRTTPLVLLGLVSALLLRWQRYAPFDKLRTRRITAALSAFVLFFTFVITLGAKKFDRYLLPAFLALDVLAALGWVGIAKLAHKRLRMSVLMPRHARVARKLPQALMMSVATTAVLLTHGLPGFLHYPYYLSYYNPLLGGSAMAPQVMMIGWGEGLDQAARYLNSKPNAEQLLVRPFYAKGPFSYFFDGKTTISPRDIPNPIDNNRLWLSSDYVVLYANQWQRQLPSLELLAYFFQHTPEHTIRINGLEYAYIYNLQTTPMTGYLALNQPRITDWDNAIRLMAYQVSEGQAGEALQVTFYLRNMAPIEQDVSALVRLVDANGQEWARSEGWPWDRATSSWQLNDIWPDTHEFILPADAPSTLQLELSFYKPATFEHLPATDAHNGEPIGQTLLVGELMVRK